VGRLALAGLGRGREALPVTGGATPAAAGRAVFVYGTLLPGEARWDLLAPFARTVAAADARGQLFDTGRGYPAAIFDMSLSDRLPGDLVPGAHVAVPDGRWPELVELLDRVEGEGTLYRRVRVVTTAGPATSYAWLGRTDRMRPLPRGWLAR
jgi:gamma-glutamylcyclotransferase (GGCT)/AIG2-like uncharacterized protein YtfP